MINKEDYEEPRCLLCMENDRSEKTDVRRLAQKLDDFYAHCDDAGAERFLFDRLDESGRIGDKALEFFVQNELIGLYRKSGRKDECLDRADKAMALAEELGIAGRGDGAYAFINAATAYKAFGYPEIAIMLFERILPVCERDMAPGYALGSFYNNAALAYCDAERFDDARAFYEKALSTMESVPDSAPERAITYLNIADLVSAQRGDDKETDALLQKAQTLLDSAVSENDTDYAFVCSKCAPVFAHYGKKEYADILSERSRRIYERA